MTRQGPRHKSLEKGRDADCKLLKLAQLRWAGHVINMSDERLPKKILCGELQVGKRPKVVRRRDTRILKDSLKDFTISTERVVETIGRGPSNVAWLRKGAWNTKTRDLGKLSRNVLSGKPEQRHH